MLIELVAFAIHQIAVHLFQQAPKLHQGDIYSVVRWQAEPRWDPLHREVIEPLEPHPTLFFHVGYMDHQYPNGLADVPGYWAEDVIFGGVVVFDRGESGEEVSTDTPVHGYANCDSLLTYTFTPVETV